MEDLANLRQVFVFDRDDSYPHLRLVGVVGVSIFAQPWLLCKLKGCLYFFIGHNQKPTGAMSARQGTVKV
jgi:hypothetical protein